MKNIGKIINIYKVLDIDKQRTKETKRKYYLCECQKCGNIVSVRADGLLKRKNCKMCRYPNLVGKQFGRLTVIKKSDKKDKVGHLYWKCHCECGKNITVLGTSLIEGSTKSCGCLHSELCSNLFFKDLSGQRFGKLTVIERAKEKEKNNRVVFKCLCDCGTICYVQSNNLKNGHTQSCGCIKSIGEYQIREILNNNKINFINEYIFSNLPNRRFDFAIFKNDKLCCLIEYDGKQHFHFVNTWHQTEEEFNNSLLRDREKDDYCKQNNIKLYRIKYTDDIKAEINKILRENKLI